LGQVQGGADQGIAKLSQDIFWLKGQPEVVAEGVGTDQRRSFGMAQKLLLQQHGKFCRHLQLNQQ